MTRAPYVRYPQAPGFFVASDGALYRDKPGPLGAPLRPHYARHFRAIETGAQLRATLRAGPCAWPGGYALYFVTSDGAVLSFKAARDNLALCIGAIRDYQAGNRHEDSGWRVVACQSTETDEEPVYCAHSGALIGGAQ